MLLYRRHAYLVAEVAYREVIYPHALTEPEKRVVFRLDGGGVDPDGVVIVSVFVSAGGFVRYDGAGLAVGENVPRLNLRLVKILSKFNDADGVFKTGEEIMPSVSASSHGRSTKPVRMNTFSPFFMFLISPLAP